MLVMSSWRYGAFRSACVLVMNFRWSVGKVPPRKASSSPFVLHRHRSNRGSGLLVEQQGGGSSTVNEAVVVSQVKVNQSEPASKLGRIGRVSAST